VVKVDVGTGCGSIVRISCWLSSIVVVDVAEGENDDYWVGFRVTALGKEEEGKWCYYRCCLRG
jgi:hypothetical protein